MLSIPDGSRSIRRRAVRRAGAGAGASCAAFAAAWLLCTAPLHASAQTGPVRRYFSEGVSNAFFSTRLAVLNPNDTPVDAVFRFQREIGGEVTKSVTIEPHARFTLDPASVEGMATQNYSTVIDADGMIVADRTVSWDGSGYGAHAETAIVAPARTWYLAEGSTGGAFTLFYLLQNPAADPVSATVRYLLPAGAPITHTYTLQPNSRTTIQVDEQPGVEETDVSAIIDAGAPIIVERAMYLSRPGQPFVAGHDSAGVTAPATEWFLAEGATGTFFDLFVLIANPNAGKASLSVEYLLPDGQVLTKPYEVAGNTRTTISVDNEEFPGSTGATRPLEQATVATRVKSLNGVPIVVERAMWWPSEGWHEAHNSAGATSTGTRWALADGEVGGTHSAQTYVLIANTSAFAGRAAVTLFFEDGTSTSRPYDLGANSRTTVGIGDDFPDARGRRFGVIVDSLGATPAQLVVERAMYANANGVPWAAGTNVVATKLEAPAGGGGGGTDGGGTGGGGTGGGGAGLPGEGTGAACPASTGPNVYPGFTYTLPTARPFLSLAQYTGVDQGSNAFKRFKTDVDLALAGNPSWGYSAVSSVIMFKLTGQEKYILDAIARVEQQVVEAENEISAGRRAPIAFDSYLDVGWYLEQLALTYDYGYNRLTAAQRLRWEQLADQAIFNVWNPSQAKWGGVTHTWSGWSICDPGNNYHYSFLRATMLWAWASQNQPWLTFLQTKKFPPLASYYAALPGGGSREGTGYGTALGNLFGNYLYWKTSTGEDLAGLSTHARETIDYWVNATVPTLDRFAPIGDLSRSSMPSVYDYHENLVHEAVVLSGNSDHARRGTWWLQQNSVNGVGDRFNLWGDLLPLPVAPLQPTARVYHATGAGALFARSGWTQDAAWMAVVAGKYDQSHAHHDQGGFTFFKNDWLAVTSNIWSHSGIHQEDEMHNVLRFVRSDGSTIRQNASDSVQSTMSFTETGSVVTVVADLKNAYSSNSSAVREWTRTLELSANMLRVHDVCTVGSGVKPIFQLHVPDQPVAAAGGAIDAGHLRITSLLPASATWTKMPTPEFTDTYRIEFTPASGCELRIDLQYQ